MDFFQNRNYSNDVVDLLVTITEDALGLDLYIYKNNQGKIQVLKYSGGPISKPIYLKSTHNDLKPVENHYDAIIHNQLLIENKETFHSKSTIASKCMDQNKSSNISNQQVFNFPTPNKKFTIIKRSTVLLVKGKLQVNKFSLVELKTFI